MKILILGYSSLCKRKIIPVLKKKFSKIKFCVCSKSQKKEDIGASEWYKNYKDALEKNIDVPKKYSEFSFHSYDTKPLPTDSLKPGEILKLRDDHFHKYFSNKKFQSKIKNKFGQNALDNIHEMLKVRLKRKLIEENL